MREVCLPGNHQRVLTIIAWDKVYVMFEYLSKYQTILVTGPQRSGTTICAKMIAHDTGHEFVSEESIAINNSRVLENLLYFTNKAKQNLVIQCPGLCRYIHKFSSENTLIVMVYRSIEAIIKSQMRIRWDGELRELAHYKYQIDDINYKPIAQVKYDFWKSDQQALVANSKKVIYESLDTHPLWILQEDRIDFKPRQTTLEKVSD